MLRLGNTLLWLLMICWLSEAGANDYAKLREQMVDEIEADVRDTSLYIDKQELEKTLDVQKLARAREFFYLADASKGIISSVSSQYRSPDLLNTIVWRLAALDPFGTSDLVTEHVISRSALFLDADPPRARQTRQDRRG